MKLGRSRNFAVLAATVSLAGCATDPAARAEQYADLLLVGLLAVAVLGLAIWRVLVLFDKRQPVDVGKPPRRRIAEWAFASEAPFSALVGALHARRADVRAEVSVELCRRLPVMAVDAFLAEEQRIRTWLYRSLSTDDVELGLAILDMAARSLDRAAQPFVTKLLADVTGQRYAARLVMTQPPDGPRLAVAAYRCLVEYRLADDAKGTTLLRSADADDSLLRAAHAAKSPEPEALLRASGEGNEEHCRNEG